MKYNNREDILELTPHWEGERLPDGRPKVPDEILDRYKNIILEEAWDILGTKLGYHDTCVATGFKASSKEIPILVGRALTAAFIPTRPDLSEIYKSSRRNFLGIEKVSTSHTTVRTVRYTAVQST